MDFEKICMMFTMQEPFYGILLSSMERIPSARFPAMAVGQSGNVFKLLYNPDFVAKHSIDTVLQALKHEVLHVAFNHFSIWNDKPSEQIHTLRNIAADMEVNSYINRSVLDADCKWCFASDEGWDNCLGTREYFKRLLQKAQQKAQAQAPQMPCNGGKGGNQQQQPQQQQQPGNQQRNQQQQGNGDPSPSQNPQQGGGGQSQSPDEVPQDFLDQFDQFDDHSMWPDDMDEVQKEGIQQMVDSLLAFAAEETEKRRGTIPGELTGRIENLKNRKPRPVADWRRFFRRYIGNEFSEVIKKSKKRESQRFPDAAGNRHRRKSHILVAVDTSGSVSMPEYMEFFGQIKALRESATFHVLECDARIQHEYDFKGNIPENLHGGGGTDFQPVIDYFNRNRKLYDSLVYFTDGYSDIPRDTPKETIWVISSSGDKNRNKYKRNGASVVFIPSKQ